jgi:hypothetical protein
VVTLPRFVGAAIRPERDHLQMVGTETASMAATVGTRTRAVPGSRSKFSSAGSIVPGRFLAG